MTSLPLTGERTVPGVRREQYWFARHEVTYRWLAPRVANQVVIEAGSGEGYGAQILARSAAAVIAVDYDPGAIQHSARRYAGTHHVRANLSRIPVARADAVVSLQVVEHLWDLPGFLSQCRQISDWIAVSTPNRLTFSPGLARGAKPTNPFHVEEFDAEQLRSMLVAAGFEHVQMFGVHHGPRLRRRPIVAEQVAAVLNGEWPNELEQFVAGVTVADFDITTGDLDTCLDLVAIAR